MLQKLNICFTKANHDDAMFQKSSQHATLHMNRLRKRKMYKNEQDRQDNSKTYFLTRLKMHIIKK